MSVIDDLEKFIRNILSGIGSTIDSLIGKIKGVLTDLIGSIRRTLDGFVDSIVGAVSDIFNTITFQLRSIVDNILSSIQNIVSTTTTYISTLIDDVILFISELVSLASSAISDIYDLVVLNIESLASGTVVLFSDIFDTVITNIQLIVDKVKIAFGDLFATVKDGVTELIGQATAVTNAIVRGIEDFIREVIDVVGTSLRDLLETISDLPATINELAMGLIESAKENIGVPISEIPQNIIDAFISKIKDEGLKETDFPTQETMKMIFGRSPVISDPEELQRTIDQSIGGKNVLSWFMRLILIPLSILQISGGIMAANAQIVLQKHALINPYRILEPADIVSARQFDLLTEEEARTELRMTGYDDNDAIRILEIGTFLPPAGELVTWWLRKFIDDDQFTAGLHKQGWIDTDIARLKQSAFFIPPVQDLITMAVREVFTPEIAKRFGQFEDFPPEFVKHAAEQGVSEEWAKNYWASHWRLPSVQMGFQMLHREVINQDDLSLLLKSSDVMPFWRDKLIAISYSPLTRVDIRRMHKVGVLTVDDVNKAYHDIGYNDENAARLTEFTVEINKDEGDDDDFALADLTRSNVVRFFNDGVFDRTTALQVLEATGVSSDAAELFIISAELQQESEERKDNIELVLERAKAGVISFITAQLDLDLLGLEELEKRKAVNKLLVEESRQNRLPSKADLDKFIKANLIAEAEYLDFVQRLGYSRQWADRYLALTRGAQTSDNV